MTDYEPHSLANALNMAYRLADLKMYTPLGMSYHPGVPFYLMSWLALALTGHPLGSSDIGMFNMLVDHTETFHLTMICLAGLAGAAGIYVFVRSAQAVVPPGVTIGGLALWLFSLPATMFTFVSPGMESFALLINALFFWVLVKLAYEHEVSERVVILAGCIGAVSYLNKLSYLYIPMGLSAAIVARLLFERTDRKRSARLVSLFILSFISAVLAVAVFVIGWKAFREVLVFHKQVILGSELYGKGDASVVSGSVFWNNLISLPANGAYGVAIALLGGIGVGIGGLVTAFRKPGHLPVAVLGIGAAVAASLSAMAVLKHYNEHYTAAVSATLPFCVVAGYLLLKAWGWRVEAAYRLVVVVAALLMAYPVAGKLVTKLTFYSVQSRMARADMQQIAALTAGSNRAIYYTYRSPFPQFGEGFVIDFASIPRLTEAYLEDRPRVLNTMTENNSKRERDVGIYVVDKKYFASADLVRNAPNLDLLGTKPVKYEEGDRLIELQTVFLLVRG
ncbi:MAG: hypothetical protein Q8M18_20100 [Bradyrhizobium sp.]|nr:hypothetical protein [Bradyrhizobium sp.]